MKTLLLTIVSFLSLHALGQNLSSENLKNLIDERVSDFEEFFQLNPTKIDDNFGDLTVYYEAIEMDDYTVDFVLTTEGKNIKKITVTNSEQRTSFFKDMGLDIEKSTPEKRNYKTLSVSLVQNKTQRKTFYNSIKDLIEVLRKPTTDLTQNHGLIESQLLNITLTINNENSVMTIL